MKKLALILVAGAALSACSGRRATVDMSEIVQSQAPIVVQAPGVVEYAWEEPMVDVLDVPPGLDPEGVYYRPAHREVVEVRQGRWTYIQKP